MENIKPNHITLYKSNGVYTQSIKFEITSSSKLLVTVKLTPDCSAEDLLVSEEFALDAKQQKMIKSLIDRNVNNPNNGSVPRKKAKETLVNSPGRKGDNRKQRILKSDKGNKAALIVCDCCDQPMTKKGGYANTGMCGVCVTGESAMLEEYGETW